jgi:hypothetical protein
MGNLWLKIKIWTKSLVFGAIVLYGLLFVLNNSGQSVKIWYWFFKPEYETSMLVLMLVTLLIGIVATLLVRTTLTTVKQIRDLRQRSRIERLEREQAAIRAKAAMLQRATSVPPARNEPPSGPGEQPMTNAQ